MSRERIDKVTDNGVSRVSGDIANFMEQNRKWQANLLDEINKNNWQANNSDHMSKFSARLDRSIRLDREVEFCRMILALLRFPGMNDRHQRIYESYRETFEWIYEDPQEAGNPWDNFVSWLQNDNNNRIYWITGKPGSGKSTLMKFLNDDPRTLQYLNLWANKHRLITAGFYFWNSGTTYQMSRIGLLQSLLYQALQNCREFAVRLFQERWEAYDSLRGGSCPWTWPELKSSFQILLSDKALRFFFLIDGLDEFGGDHHELVELIVSASTLSNVKICAASRPWLVFEDGFEGRPSLLLEQLTYEDIKLYVTAKFNENKHYIGLQKREHAYALDLVENIVQKASGVFLWVYLVVDSLLRGLNNSDRISDLQKRLEAIPSDLEALFDKLLNSLEPFYFTHACQLIQIVRAAQKPLTLLAFSFADEEDTTAAMKAKIGELDDNERLERIEGMRRRLLSRCKGFIEVPAYQSKEVQVEYLHRTAKDFLEDPQIWSKIVGATDDSFDPNRSLSNSFLFQLKTTSVEHMSNATYWDLLSWCLEYATQVELSTGEVQASYINEVGRTATATAALLGSMNGSLLDIISGASNYVWSYAEYGNSISFKNFMQLAVRCGLFSYFQTNVDQLSVDELTFLLRTAANASSVLPSFSDKQALSGRPFPDSQMTKLLLDHGARSRKSFAEREMPLKGKISSLIRITIGSLKSRKSGGLRK
jgi:hypothetical protein